MEDDTGKRTYTISKGDNLSSIAEALGYSVEELAAYNNISNPDLIRAGATLSIPSASVATLPVTGQGTPVATPASSASPSTQAGGDGGWGDYSDAVDAGIKLGNAAYAQSEGFDVKPILDEDGKPTGKVAVYGSQAANEALDLPKNFRTSSAENARLLEAKGFNPKVGAAILDDLKPTKLGGVLTLAGAALDVAQSTVKYQQGTIIDVPINS